MRPRFLSFSHGADEGVRLFCSILSLSKVTRRMECDLSTVHRKFCTLDQTAKLLLYQMMGSLCDQY